MVGPPGHRWFPHPPRAPYGQGAVACSRRPAPVTESQSQKPPRRAASSSAAGAREGAEGPSRRRGQPCWLGIRRQSATPATARQSPPSGLPLAPIQRCISSPVRLPRGTAISSQWLVASLTPGPWLVLVFDRGCLPCGSMFVACCMASSPGSG